MYVSKPIQTLSPSPGTSAPMPALVFGWLLFAILVVLIGVAVFILGRIWCQQSDDTDSK